MSYQSDLFEFNQPINNPLQNIPTHKIFISFKYTEHRHYKYYLEKLNDIFDNNIFVNYSLSENEIEEEKYNDEGIRRIIRDNYIQDATVLILLNGQGMRDSKFIDWEIQAAMTDTDLNPKMGILVINLPENKNGMIDSSGEVKKITGGNWERTLSKDYYELIKEYPHTPKRILKNLCREKVKIDFIDWDKLISNNNYESAVNLKWLIDVAFKRKNWNDYDISDPLQRRTKQ